MCYHAGSNFPETMGFMYQTKQFYTPENSDYDENLVEGT
jgi:hypothetical protein